MCLILLPFVFYLMSFERYPKQQRLLHLKRAAVDSASLSPHYLPLTRLRTMNPAKFDVILIDPPFHSPSFSWETLSTFPIPQLAGDPSFVFMWVGSGASDGLERGREVLARWGYRRCEDVVWVKTNKECNKGPGVRTFSSYRISLCYTPFALSLFWGRLVTTFVVY